MRFTFCTATNPTNTVLHLRKLPRVLDINSLHDCFDKLGALSVREARHLGMIPVTYTLHPDRDRKVLVSVVQDMAVGGIECALVAKMFPKNLLSRKQREGHGNAFGVEVWRALHRRRNAKGATTSDRAAFSVKGN